MTSCGLMSGGCSHIRLRSVSSASELNPACTSTSAPINCTYYLNYYDKVSIHKEFIMDSIGSQKLRNFTLLEFKFPKVAKRLSSKSNMILR